MEKLGLKITICFALLGLTCSAVALAGDMRPLEESEMATVFGGTWYECMESKTDGKDCPTPGYIICFEGEECDGYEIEGSCERERRVCGTSNPYWNCDQFNGSCSNTQYTKIPCTWVESECQKDYLGATTEDCGGTFTYATDEER